MDKIIEIKNLSKSFGDKKVLEDINLYVRRGEFLTLLGPSGCGKTTLLRMIAGFLQPDEGSILMDGKELAGVPKLVAMSDYEDRDEIGRAHV